MDEPESYNFWKEQYEDQRARHGSKLAVLPEDSYLAKRFIYPYLDMNAYSYMVLGISLLALHNMGNWHLVAGAVLIAAERANFHIREKEGVGISGIFSQFSGYMVAAQVFKNPSFLTRIWSYFLVLQNVANAVIDGCGGWTQNTAHLQGHFLNFVIGFILGWIMLTRVGIKVINL